MKKFFQTTVLVLAMIVFTTGCKKDSVGPNSSGGNGSGSTPTTEGIYLGIIGFNQHLTNKEIALLNRSSLQTFNSFIDQLNMENGTGLYYADYTALKKLKSYAEPPKLNNVALVTFTDGLDNVSLANDETNPEHYTSTDAYSTALNNKISHEQIHGNKVNAYTIGIKGPDVFDEEEFHNNLNKLASSSNNVFEVTDMNEALQRFAEIAESLHSVSTTSTLKLQLPGGYNDGVMIRLTFDNVSSAENSTKYIECIYKWTTNGRNLENVTYHGLINGATTLNSTTQLSNSYYEFEFKNLSYTNGNIISQSDINNLKLWRQISSGAWQPDVEFTPANSSQVTEEQSSALIMLVLDCTTSLGNQFENMKTGAKRFVETLVTSAPTPPTPTPDYTNIILNELNGDTKFIEIFNKGEVDLSINGWYITKDGNEADHKWTADATVIVPAHGYVLLYSEDVQPDHPDHPENLFFHSGLSAKKSLRIALYMANGTERDVFVRESAAAPSEWGVVMSNIAPRSYARTPNGGVWKLANPTPGSVNPSSGDDIPQE